MNLPMDIDSDENWDVWESFLQTVDREELMDVLLSRMSYDAKFMRHMYETFAKDDSEQIENLKKAFETEFDIALAKDEPDLEYMTSVIYLFINEAKLLKEDSKELFRSFLLEKMDSLSHMENLQDRDSLEELNMIIRHF